MVILGRKTEILKGTIHFPSLMENWILRKYYSCPGHNIVFREKSETVRKMALVSGPEYFPDRRETYGRSKNVGCFLHFYSLLVIKHSIPQTGLNCHMFPFSNSIQIFGRYLYFFICSFKYWYSTLNFSFILWDLFQIPLL